MAAPEVEAELLALIQRAEARTLHRRYVHEHILRAVIRLDEPESFLGVEPTVPCDILFHHATRRPALHGPKYFFKFGSTGYDIAAIEGT